MTSDTPQRFFGKYRGTVFNTVDPMQIGRIMAIVPDVFGVIPSSWAMPCFPFAGQQYGMFALPQVGAGVWIEFEQGDTDKPIWSGCWYGLPSEPPAGALLIPPMVPGVCIQTTLQNSLTISDTPGPTGGIFIKTTAGTTVAINDISIMIQNGKGASIQMIGASVIINNGALVIT